MAAQSGHVANVNALLEVWRRRRNHATYTHVALAQRQCIWPYTLRAVQRRAVRFSARYVPPPDRAGGLSQRERVAPTRARCFGVVRVRRCAERRGGRPPHSERQGRDGAAPGNQARVRVLAILREYAYRLYCVSTRTGYTA